MAELSTGAPSDGLRVAPRVWIGFAIWIGYLVLVVGIQSLSGVPYDQWGASGRNLFFGADVSLLVATVLLIVTTSALGWWRPAMFERSRSRHRWPIFIPVVMALVAVTNLLGTDWSAYSTGFLAASLVLVLVGFTEELVNRGLLLVALRSRLAEVWVWLISSALFGASHLVNILLGAPAGGTVIQVVAAFLSGTVFYILRRTTGSLVWSMILHGLWDFSVFATGVGTPNPFVFIGNVVVLLNGLVGLACVAFVIRDAHPHTATPAA